MPVSRPSAVSPASQHQRSDPRSRVPAEHQVEHGPRPDRSHRPDALGARGTDGLPVLAGGPQPGRAGYTGLYNACECGGPKRKHSQHCNTCAGVGTRLSSNARVALAYGTNRRLVKSLGGAAKLEAMDADARELLLRPYKRPAGSPKVAKSVRARREQFAEGGA